MRERIYLLGAWLSLLLVLLITPPLLWAVMAQDFGLNFLLTVFGFITAASD